MKVQTKIAVGAVAVAAVMSAVYMAPTAFAYRGDPTTVGPNHTAEREAALEIIMQKKDFAGWKTVMTEDGRQPGVLRIIDTQAEFNTFAEAWLLTRTGNAADLEKAKQLRADLGLGAGQGGRHGGGRGQGNGGNFVDANKDGVCDRMQ